MSNPFDYVTAVSHTKEDLMTGTANDVLMERGYTPFLVNNALSYHADTILHANLMNTRPFLENRPQFYFFLNSIRPRKRYAKWAKKDSNDDIIAVQKTYGYSYEKAKDALLLLSEEELKAIKKRLVTGVEQ